MSLALMTDGVTLSFGRRQVLRGLDLRVPAGAVYGFLGRNGSGKTTTIRMLMGILRPGLGTLTLGEQTVSRTRPAMRRGLGYVSQQQNFYPWMSVRRLSRFVGALYPTWDQSRFEALCAKLDVPLKQRVRELSGGTKMKLALALAVAHRPPLLILDEPTAGVDPVTRREILDLLRDMARDEGVTVFFSTHQISEVEDIGDHLGILHAGQIFWQGPVAELSSRVRRIAGPVPEGLQSLRCDADGTLVWGDPARIAALPDARPVSLEAAFVAIALQDAPP